MSHMVTLQMLRLALIIGPLDAVDQRKSICGLFSAVRKTLINNIFMEQFNGFSNTDDRTTFK